MKRQDYFKLQQQWANRSTRPPETTSAPAIAAEKKSPEERKQLLAASVQAEIKRGTGHVESQSDFYATLVRGHRPSHLLHLILSIITLGLWLVVWVLVSLGSGEKRTMLSVDEYGNITARRI